MRKALPQLIGVALMVCISALVIASNQLEQQRNEEHRQEMEILMVAMFEDLTNRKGLYKVEGIPRDERISRAILWLMDRSEKPADSATVDDMLDLIEDHMERTAAE